jgi:hypothetical protein
METGCGSVKQNIKIDMWKEVQPGGACVHHDDNVDNDDEEQSVDETVIDNRYLLQGYHVE